MTIIALSVVLAKLVIEFSETLRQKVLNRLMLLPILLCFRELGGRQRWGWGWVEEYKLRITNYELRITNYEDHYGTNCDRCS